MLEYDGHFLSCDDKWVVDLRRVNFITLKQNWEDQNYHVKLHIGTKEVRLILSTQSLLEELKEEWKKANEGEEYE
tara:strand:+ start:3103 stop:3327 length:225 start_codon:yes stop_codon:yes gene_type:complete